ncbi:hypothetical protein LTR64_004987 [Lithohypha guttulata]|uniref:uncharacterized protein n=1 Tax=Lithohypha guttulata TaxID=1690604 RepID=UPI002DDF2E93|nr:hypothetical protein LTR51_005176 [Lithohypha guttulata]
MHLLSTLFLVIQCLHALANVEKTIFTAPEHVPIPRDAAIDNLLLYSLNPARLKIRKYLNASFPSDDKPHGEESWALLEGLRPGQRYELRVCWLATQPTVFRLDTYTMAESFETSGLISSLSTYSYSRRDALAESDVNELVASKYVPSAGADNTSLLFLRIQAAADYFSLNKTLMEIVPPVHVDLILDPYLLNVFPRSLVPTAIYIAIIAFFSWFLADRSNGVERASARKKLL